MAWNVCVLLSTWLPDISPRTSLCDGMVDEKWFCSDVFFCFVLKNRVQCDRLCKQIRCSLRAHSPYNSNHKPTINQCHNMNRQHIIIQPEWFLICINYSFNSMKHCVWCMFKTHIIPIFKPGIDRIWKIKQRIGISDFVESNVNSMHFGHDLIS